MTTTAARVRHPSIFVAHAPVSQPVEEAVSNTVQCGFESHPGHQTPEWQETPQSIITAHPKTLSYEFSANPLGLHRCRCDCKRGHNESMTKLRAANPNVLQKPLKLFIALNLPAIALLSACSNGNSDASMESGASASQSADDHFEGDAQNDSILTDEAGNELSMGDNIELPTDWPAQVPTPAGSLIAVSIIDSSTAIGTWAVTGDVYAAQEIFKGELDTLGYSTKAAPDLSAEGIVVFTAQGNGLDVTVSATIGEKDSDPGQITILVNPGF